MKKMQLLEHAGFERAHDPHTWWIYDARETSPKTCPVCIGLHQLHYRGDEIDTAFPHHLHMRVNAIRARKHPNCRCVLRWAGRTEDVLTQPYGVRPPKKPKIPKKLDLTPRQKRDWKSSAKHARETFQRRRRWDL